MWISLALCLSGAVGIVVTEIIYARRRGRLEGEIGPPEAGTPPTLPRATTGKLGRGLAAYDRPTPRWPPQAPPSTLTVCDVCGAAAGEPCDAGLHS